MKKNITTMRAVAEDIIKIKFDWDKTFESLQNEFYDIMRKYGIKQGTKDPNGVGILKNNFEWTMAQTLFLEQLRTQTQFEMFFKNVPEDLDHY